ncbi:MAG: lysine--tRNA ligase [Candidatus Levybacteria bacterium RIFCSPHIGHO2_12_FULL_38_12]|nr:MAG: lysine--tRNA ligase [Candidatus Levybacteria bacterium RIFCSPHIGHO2_12_FULL_38_12]
MFWADAVSQEIIKSGKYKPYWVDDMKTPSGRIHVGALRGVVVHDLVYKALKDSGVKAKYTYVFENHDPMDTLPVYLPKEKFEKYLGMPLFKVPSPEQGFENFAVYYAEEFKKVFNAIGCEPEILWTKDLYTSGKMNYSVKLCLDNTDIIRGIYKELYKKELPKDWYPFQVYCPNCEKVSTTTVTGWDGKEVNFCCNADKLDWTKGCGICGKISPFSDSSNIAGKLPWKVEWAVKWKVIGVTIEGAGKDHMSRGGSHDLASLVCQRVLDYPVPYPVGYEWFLIGGRKMSTSKGVGSSAIEMLEILPPELLRFLMVKTNKDQQINFDPYQQNTIPHLFDEYQRASDAYFKKGDEYLARIFELSQVNGVEKPPVVRFSQLAQWVQMSNMEQKIKEEGLEEWAKYVRIWVEKYASESEKFLVQKELPEQAKNLPDKQKEFLKLLSSKLDANWEAEDFQKQIFGWAKEIGISSKDAFTAIYCSLLGKDHGPKAGWLILSLDKEFVKKRFEEIFHSNNTYYHSDIKTINSLNKQDVFSIEKTLAQKFPSISIGIAIIKNVSIEKSNPELEKEKAALLGSLENLTTEQLGTFPDVLSYRKLYKATGIDWHSRRPSPEALLRRVALKKGLYKINTCVDAYNLIVMKHRISVGAFDLDALEFPTVLRFAKKGEKIYLLGDEQPTEYKKGEVAYFDKKGGFNIDFNYRDSIRTAVQLHTKNLYINVDGVFDISPKKVGEVLKETCDVIIKYCGGTVELFGIETVF